MEITTETRLTFEAESALWEAVRRELKARRARQAAGPRTWTDLLEHLPCSSSALTHRRYEARRRISHGERGMLLDGSGELTVESVAKALDWPGASMTVEALLAAAGIAAGGS